MLELKIPFTSNTYAMLDLIAVTYRNIWPFKDQTLSLFFEQGKYLIKAPIGSGKSFLFFDGPSYALYKTSSRNLLNIQSKAGAIKLLFEINGQTYLIKRLLKKGKSKDSCASQLFELPASGAEILEKIKSWSILSQGLDIEKLLTQHNILCTEIPFKNESDLQQQLSQLLPPTEVFSSTVLLLQDAENIFEMQPAQRLEVLKNVFNLLGIEESKEVVKERRNELKFQIKAFQDTSRTEDKLRLQLRSLISNYQTLQWFPEISEHLLASRETIEELESFLEKLGIENFQLTSELETLIAPIEEFLSKQSALLTEHKTALALLETQSRNLTSQIASQLSEKKSKADRQAQLFSLLASINPQTLVDLRAQKVQLQTQQSALEKNAFAQQIEQFYHHQQARFAREAKSDFSLLANMHTVNQFISLGTQLKSQNELLENKVSLLKSQANTQKDKLQLQLTSLQEKQKFYAQQLQSLTEKIAHFEQSVATEARFECAEISAPCPFIKAINKQHFEQREQEKNKMLTEKSTLEATITAENLQSQIETLLSQLQSPSLWAEFAEQEKTLHQEMEINRESIQLLKSFFQTIDHKLLTQSAQERSQLQQQLSQLEKSILEQEQLAHNLEQYQKEQIEIASQLEGYEKQLAELEKQKSDLGVQIAALQSKIADFPAQSYNQIYTSLQAYRAAYRSLQTIIAEHQETQLKTKQLLQEEKLLNNLYTILNKELLLFVLSEFLPVLSEIINSYLVNVVDYQIQIRLQETSEKLELETKIIDEKWERDIKSLSGGQRAILKLVWMLAISSYMKTKLLFLDETINNLDNDTVGRVADLLNDFVKQRTMKFYTITHNSEIQSMNIRDEVLEIEKIGKS